MSTYRYPVRQGETGQPIYWMIGQIAASQPHDCSMDDHEIAFAVRYLQYANGQRISHQGVTVVNRHHLEPWAA